MKETDKLDQRVAKIEKRAQESNDEKQDRLFDVREKRLKKSVPIKKNAIFIFYSAINVHITPVISTSWLVKTSTSLTRAGPIAKTVALPIAV